VAAHYRSINAGTRHNWIRGGIRFSNPEGLIAFNAVVDYECRFEEFAGRDRVICTEWIYDDFYGAAGLTNTAETEFLIMEDCSLCAQTPGLSCPAADARWNPESLRFLTRFEEWLAAHHPDVTRWIWMESPGFMGPAWQGNPCALYPIEGRPDPHLQAYVADFIAWSDDYPVEGSPAWAAQRFNRIIEAGLAPGAPISPDYSWYFHVTAYSCGVERDWDSVDELMYSLGGDAVPLLQRRLATVISICPNIDTDDLSAAISADWPGYEVDYLRDLAGAMYLAAG
jgi:hypothetical protein